MFCQRFSTDVSVRQREMEVENKMNLGNYFQGNSEKKKPDQSARRWPKDPGNLNENNVGSRRTPVRVCSERKPKTKIQRSLSQPLLYFSIATVDTKSWILIFVKRYSKL
jgi:pyocin large subunit-like protein